MLSDFNEQVCIGVPFTFIRGMYIFFFPDKIFARPQWFNAGVQNFLWMLVMCRNFSIAHMCINLATQNSYTWSIKSKKSICTLQVFGYVARLSDCIFLHPWFNVDKLWPYCYKVSICATTGCNTILVFHRVLKTKLFQISVIIGKQDNIH